MKTLEKCTSLPEVVEALQHEVDGVRHLWPDNVAEVTITLDFAPKETARLRDIAATRRLRVDDFGPVSFRNKDLVKPSARWRLHLVATLNHPATIGIERHEGSAAA